VQPAVEEAATTDMEEELPPVISLEELQIFSQVRKVINLGQRRIQSTSERHETMVEFNMQCSIRGGVLLLRANEVVHFIANRSSVLDICIIGEGTAELFPRVELQGHSMKATGLRVTNCELRVSGAGAHVTRCHIDGCNTCHVGMHISQAQVVHSGQERIILEDCEVKDATVALLATHSPEVMINGGRYASSSKRVPCVIRPLSQRTPSMVRQVAGMSAMIHDPLLAGTPIFCVPAKKRLLDSCTLRTKWRALRAQAVTHMLPAPRTHVAAVD
jgi:hypothetical protein